MWFSHVSSPLGPRVRTSYKFVLDFLEDCNVTILNKFANIFTLECLDISIVSDVMRASYVDPDVVDVVKNSMSTKGRVVLASYY
ncbi:MAG: hypothetical protein QXY36_02350 [Sulfolobales archaeon]